MYNTVVDNTAYAERIKFFRDMDNYLAKIFKNAAARHITESWVDYNIRYLNCFARQETIAKQHGH